MAHHKAEKEDSTLPMEEEEEEVAFYHHGGGGGGQHGGLPIQHPSSGSLSATEVDQEESSSAKNRPVSATSCLLPARSLRSTATVTPAVEAQEPGQAQADGGVRSLSFSKLFSFRMARAPSSLSTLDCIHQPDAAAAASCDSFGPALEEEKLKRVCRSQSVPTSARRCNGKAGQRRVADSSSIGTFRLRVVSLAHSAAAAAAGPEETAAGEEEAAEVAAEEAVCRICMVALSEGGGGGDGEGREEAAAVLKLECCCKGELALAHRACAIKWFSIKGNGTCDVCSQEVLNLPVTLRRLHTRASSAQAAAAAAAAAQAQSVQQQEEQADSTRGGGGRRYRVWHGTPILVIISMLAYFCFLEQLLVGDHGTAALAISLPFACVLGLFSSLTTTKMVSRRYVWIYSAVQFLFIVFFTHLFYRYVRMQAVIAIILSTFAGFSMAICANSVLLQILRWRARRVAAPTGTEEEGRDSWEPPAADLEIALPPP